MRDRALSNEATTLDPADWSEIRAQGHRMLDDMFGYLEHLRSRPVWKPMPDDVRANFRQPLPRLPSSLASVHAEFIDHVLPYALGNTHPAFMGWVHGGGSAVGFSGGRYLQLDKQPHNNLFVSIAQAMGVQTNTFGNADVCTGPLAGLRV